MLRIVALLAAANLAVPAAAAPVDFARDVRPILAQHCFKCHGPDDATRKAGLRLDLRAAAITKAKSGETAIVPGRPEQSELIRRLHVDDDAELMPPPATKKPLSAAQKAVLRQWIAEGAGYSDHWAFIAPRWTARPPVKNVNWTQNAIDTYILARLEAGGLSPSPPADKFTLVRRLYLDLIGLPPTPEEADAFVSDSAPDAYARLVDRLLASSHYGERWARKWLDLARYADTNGYEKDRQRTMWLYRDWVINALNADMPFDRFTIEQIAGDMLPGATLEQRLGTGFHRNTMLNEEGGADPLEFRWHALNDRVATTGTVWLGLTLNCCQCHNHKYDPIAQREYYQLAAFLNNCDEPTIDVPFADIDRRRSALEQQLRAREAELAKHFPGDPLLPPEHRSSAEARQRYLDARFQAWLEIEKQKAVAWTVVRPTSAKGNIPTLTVEADAAVFVSGDKSKRDVYELAAETGLKTITAMRIEVLPDERLPANGPGRVSYEGPFGDYFLCELTVSNNGQPVKVAGATGSYWDGNNKPENAADGNVLTGWSINGGQGKAHEIVFNFAEPLHNPGQLQMALLFEKYYAAGLGKFRISVTDAIGKAEARGIPNDLTPLLQEPSRALTADERQRLKQHFLATAPELKAQRDDIARQRQALPKHPTALVMMERPAGYTRTTFLHKRGEFTQPLMEVKSGVPAVFPALPSGANRLDFARWLVRADNPLTARVTVNRAWAAFFGRGLVRTTEDFGFQGESPTHPALLDWLALEFMHSGWSMKKLHKTIVMSATYQQSSQVTPGLLELDPKNELLARAPRLRLDAEVVRDNALKVSGLLTPKIGGPSVFPPQPAAVTAEGAYGALKWDPSPGSERYRRGLYTFAKRTAPFAAFTVFDAPSGEACVARREVSNTPLQALTLLNDAAFVEAADALGRQIAATLGTPAEKAALLWRRCLTRPPTRSELALVLDFYETQRRRLPNANGARGKQAATAEDLERRAWSAAVRALMNLDEMVTRD